MFFLLKRNVKTIVYTCYSIPYKDCSDGCVTKNQTWV